MRRPRLHRSLAALVLLLSARSLGAQATLFVPVDPAEEAAALRSLRSAETELVRALARSGGDPETGGRLGEPLRASHNHLDQPSPALRRAISTAPDPAALALKIVGDGGGSYETGVLLAALASRASRPRRTALWLRAAQTTEDTCLRLAFLEQAQQGLGLTAADPRRADASAATAAWRLREMLDHGLAREALAALDALPAAVRERLQTGLAGDAAVDGVTVIPPHPDVRLDLAVARLLAGDPAGARVQLARAPVPAAAVPDRERSAAARERALLERSIAGNDAADPFPILAEIVSSDLFTLEARIPSVSLLAFVGLAEREGYPTLAAYAWRRAGDSLALESWAQEHRAPLPREVERAAGLLCAALSAQARQAAAAAEPARHATWARVTELSLGLSPDGVQLLAFDREGRHGLVLIQRDNRADAWALEQRDGTWRADTVGGWVW